MDLQIVINKQHRKKISCVEGTSYRFSNNQNLTISHRGKWCLCNAQHSSCVRG